jgi:hypothetical protein
MDLDREDVAAFVSLWSRTLVPFSLVTASTIKVLSTLQELAAMGGVLQVPSAPNSDENVAAVSER